VGLEAAGPAEFSGFAPLDGSRSRRTKPASRRRTTWTPPFSVTTAEEMPKRRWSCLSEMEWNRLRPRLAQWPSCRPREADRRRDL